MVFIDLITVISICLFIYILNARQEEFIDAFKDSTIQMDDYALKFKGFPHDKEFAGKEHLLKARLWEHLEKVMNESQKCNDYLKSNRLRNDPTSREIVDISFGM